MDFKLLQIFQAVYETSSISRAAEVLELSQPTVTASIKKLESELGYSCFLRSGRGIVASHNGSVLYKSTANHLNALNSAITPKEHLTVYAASNVMRRLKHANIKVIESPSDENEVYEALRLQQCDIAIDYITKKEQSYNYVPLFKERIVGISCNPIAPTLEEYLDASHIVMKSARHSANVNALYKHLPKRKVFAEVNNVMNMISMVLDSNHIGVTATSMLPLIKQLGLHTFKLPYQIDDVPFTLIYHKRNEGNPAFLKAIEDIKTQIKLSE